MVESAQVQRSKPFHEDPGFKRWFQLGAWHPYAVEGKSLADYNINDGDTIVFKVGRRRCKLDPGLKAPPRSSKFHCEKDDSAFIDLKTLFAEPLLPTHPTPRTSARRCVVCARALLKHI